MSEAEVSSSITANDANDMVSKFEAVRMAEARPSNRIYLFMAIFVSLLSLSVYLFRQSFLFDGF